MTRDEVHELLHRFYHRDREPLLVRMGDDYVCHTPGSNPIAGAHRGRDGMLAHVADMQERTGGTFRPHHLGAFITDGQWALVPVHLRAERAGLTLDQPAFGIWRFHDGRVTDHWECPTDMAAFDAFWNA
ncbi:MAG: nuclear transport factor 2 family protein [Burkholderiaceae bacterium]